MKQPLAVGVDIGATKVRVCVGNIRGELIWKAAKQIPIGDSVEDLLGGLATVVREGVERAHRSGDLSGIGIASAGPLDLGKGAMLKPANLPYDTVPLVGPIEGEFGCRTLLLNDATAAALGERTFGAGRDHPNLLYVTLSTGVGGGAIVDGHLLIGKDGNAAEVGHFIVDPAMRLRCGCGRKGHWEAYCSGRNIPRLAALVAGDGRKPASVNAVSVRLGARVKPDSAVILARAGEGNRFALRVVREMGRMNAMGVANAVNMFDPSLVTVGGSVALNNEELVMGPIKELVPTFALARPPEIRITPLGEDIGLLGAVALVFGS